VDGAFALGGFMLAQLHSCAVRLHALLNFDCGDVMGTGASVVPCFTLCT
jgi:hypothetical protein